MTVTEQAITISLCVAATMLTRFLPFLIFREKAEPPRIVKYLGDALPPAIYGLLLVYCLKNVDVFGGTHGIPELIAIAVTIAAHLWKRNMLFSITAGTAVYMLIVNNLAS